MSKHVLTQAASYLDIRRLKLASVTEVKQQSSELCKQASMPRMLGIGGCKLVIVLLASWSAYLSLPQA